MSHAQPGESRSSAERYTEQRTPPDSPSTSQHTHSSPSTSPSFKFDSPPRASTAGSATWSPPPSERDDKSQSHGSDQEATSEPKAASATSSPAQSDSKRPPVRRFGRVTRLRGLGSSTGESNDGDREIEWAGLKDFFLAPLTDDIDTTVVPEIVWEDGKPRLKSRGRLLSFQEDNQSVQVYDPSVIPDVVLLTREAFEADPSLVATWTSDDEDGYDDTRSWSQVAAVAEFDNGPMTDSDSESESETGSLPQRIRESLRTLVTHSLRSHAFGFDLYENILEIVLHTPSGRFCSPVIYCTEANGYLSTFLARLLSLSDRELGSELPPRVPRFHKRCSGSPRLEDIRILETLFQSASIFGRHTSAFRVSAGREGSTAHTEYAMTVSFVEEARCDEHDRIRLTIANASPDDRQGLTNVVDVYRERDFVVVPRFFPDTLDASEWGLKPRALEVTFHEQCFEPICVVDSTKALARVILGAVQGLDSLYRLRILHRDVSASNVMVTSDGNGVLIDYDTAVFMDGPEGEAERQKNAGTLAFRARELVEEYEGRPAFFHEPWHDIESLVYVIVYTVFIMPSGPDDSSELSEDVKSIWRQWNSQLGAVNSKDELFLAPWGARHWFEPFKEFWKEDLRALVQTVAKYCGLGVQRSSWAAQVDEAAILEPLWASGEFSHGLLASGLDALIERIVEGTARDRAPSTVQGGDRTRSDLVA
ncbi:BZ3500_MvSof-1268-A1-R1_Chr3-3g06560 [Microbotryum saponariae]|uniref:BZ3500_MvSof-1268-A1-R1_Chr3-3g06560 protein n=1 Tax=Microbotryum saponariae TaxID=289078 RepID=A0A2X0NHA0_9BASI|nr:BZ3500_MvSof-1268-A1-R1_Chr3-3g06560 [Microbotryum saponariae]SDA04527.1 BZ3501_MvSof-1269-A2-R1_Chr3-2g06247 [Microbotryum saponariae]